MLNHEARRQEHRHIRVEPADDRHGVASWSRPADAGRYPPPMPNSSTFPPRLTCPQRARLRADAPRDLRAESARIGFLSKTGSPARNASPPGPVTENSACKWSRCQVTYEFRLADKGGYFPFRTFGRCDFGAFLAAFGVQNVQCGIACGNAFLQRDRCFGENEKMMMASVSELDPALEHLDMIFALVDF